MRAFSVISKSRIPSFIKENPEYEFLKNFIEAYYDWLSQEFVNKNDFRNIVDIDKAPDEFLKYYKESIAKNFVESTTADYRFVLKNIDALFKAKGTEKAIKYFFKAVYNEDIDINFPADSIFHGSDAIWVRKRSIAVLKNGYSVSDFNEKGFTFGLSGRGYIESVVDLGTYYRLFVSDIRGDLNSVNTITIDDHSFTLQKQIIGCKVINPGTYFVEGTVYKFDNLSIAIKETIRGKLSSIEILDAGSGFEIGEQLVLSVNGPYGKSQGTGAVVKVLTTGDLGSATSFEILNGGYLYDLPPGVIVDSGSFRLHGNIGGIKTISIVDSAIGLNSTETIDIGNAQFQTILGNVTEYDGNFNEIRGAPSSVNTIFQNEDYYQYFSYVIKSSKNISVYEDVLKKLLHPAGMVFFAELQILQNIKVSDIVNFDSSVLINVDQTVQNEYSIEELLIELLIISSKNYLFKNNMNGKIDSSYKFKLLNESTFINRFKNEKISDWIASSTIKTKLQPDAVVTIE